MADPSGDRFAAASDFSDPSPPTPIQKLVNLQLLVGSPPPPPPLTGKLPQRSKQSKKQEREPLLEQNDYVEERLRAAMFDEIPSIGDDPILDSRSVGSHEDVADFDTAVWSEPTKSVKTPKKRAKTPSKKTSRSTTPSHRNASPQKHTKLRPRSLSRNRNSRNSRSASRQGSSDRSRSSSRKSSFSGSGSSRRSKSSTKKDHRRSKSRSRGSDSSSVDKKKSGFFRKLFAKRKSKPDDSTSVATDHVSTKSKAGKPLTSKPSETSSLTASVRDDKFVPQLATAVPRVQEDQPTLFFATDEVSTLTNPTIHSQKKSDEDPMGSYWNEELSKTPTIDPFREPFFPEPAGESPVKQKSPQKRALTVRRTFIDPSPRGQIQARDAANDPVPTPTSENRENIEHEDQTRIEKAPDSNPSSQASLGEKDSFRRPHPINSDPCDSRSPVSSRRLRVSEIIQNTADAKLANGANSPNAITPKARNLSSFASPKLAPLVSKSQSKAKVVGIDTHSMWTKRTPVADAFSLKEVRPTDLVGTQMRHIHKDSSSRLLASYSRGKFKNRAPLGSSCSGGEMSVVSHSSQETSDSLSEKLFQIPGYSKAFAVSNLRVKGRNPKPKGLDGIGTSRDVRLTTFVVSKGFDLFRYQREYDIATGASDRIVPEKVAKEEPSARRKTQPDRAIHPVRLAGRRILSQAAVPIQTSFRRYMAQNEAVDRMWALIEIQSYYRRWRAEAGLLATIVCTVTIQAMIRGYLVRRTFRFNHHAATQIQKVIRGYLSALMTFESVYRIVLVQAQVRGWFTRRRIKKISDEFREHLEFTSALKIQTWWRSRSSRLMYQFLLVDTIITQAVIRRHLASCFVGRLKSERQFRSAVSIQTVWRGYSTYSWFTKTLAALLIQKIWRGHVAYRQVKGIRSAVKIQKLWRGYEAHSYYVAYVCARRIQSVWRGYRAYSYHIAYVSARQIQCAWRGHRAYSYTKAYLSARKIQRSWRGHRDFSVYVTYISARKVQCAWRVYQAYTKYESQRAARVLQTAWRGFSARSTFGSYRAARTIQAQWRAYVAYWDFKANIATRNIQAIFRGYVAYWDFKAYKSSRLIQKIWRGHSSFRNTRNTLSARSIQALWRAYQARCLYETHLCARDIQSTWRMHKEAKRYKSTMAAIKIQAIWRGFQGYTDFIFCLVDLLLLQRTVRKWIAVRKAHERRRQRATLRIQTSWRRHNHQVAYLRHFASIKIQKEWRCYSGYTNYIVLLADVISVQCAIRCWFARLRTEERLKCRGATEIQRTWRGWRVLTAYRQHRSSIMIQAAWRCYRIYWAFQHHMAAVRIQTLWRRHWQQRAYKEFSAARTLQKCWRRYNAYMYLLFSIANAIILQRSFRMYRAIRQKKDLKMARAATKIQSVWRGFHTKCVVFEAILASMQIEHASVTIQAYWRRYAATSSLRFHMANMARNDAATRIQSCWRSHFAKTVVSQARATVVLIQSVSRRHQAINHAHSRRSAIVGERDANSARVIQHFWREFTASTRCKKNDVATKLQSLWRMHVTKRHSEQLLASVVIQACWRMQSVMRHYQDFMSARKIQTMWRMFLIHRMYNQLHASIKIEKTWRRFVKFRDFARFRASRKIQCIWRMYQAHVIVNNKVAEELSTSCLRTETTQDFSVNLRAAHKVQSYEQLRINRALYRDYKAARKIQAYWRMYIVNVMYVEFKCARMIQGQWRGHRQQRHFISQQFASVKIQSIVRRLISRLEYHVRQKSCILIQSHARRFLASTIFSGLRVPDILVLVEAQALRERLAISKIQFWWSVVLDCRKEKRAALVIERFFIKIKVDIDAEIVRQEKKKARRLNSKKSEDVDELFFDTAWEKALESVKSDSSSDIFNFSDHNSPSNEQTQPSASKKKNRSVPPRSPSSNQDSTQMTPMHSTKATSVRSPGSSAHSSHSPNSLSRSIRQSSPSRRLIMRHEKEQPRSSSRGSSSRSHRSSSRSSSRSRRAPASATSARGTSSALERAKAITRSHSLSSTDLTDNISLEEAFLEAEASHAKEKRQSVDQYLRKYKRTTPQKPVPVERFFADDLESLDDSTVVQVNETFASPRPATIPENSPPPPSHVGDRTPVAPETFASPLSKKYGSRIPSSTRSSTQATRSTGYGSTGSNRSKSTPRSKSSFHHARSRVAESYLDQNDEPIVFTKKPREAKIYGTEYGLI